jgi:sulfur-carrier protein
MTIFIPTPLRAYTAGKDAVEVNAATIAGSLDELTTAYPDCASICLRARVKRAPL